MRLVRTTATAEAAGLESSGSRWTVTSTKKNVLSADLLPNSTLLEICLRQPGHPI